MDMRQLEIEPEETALALVPEVLPAPVVPDGVEPFDPVDPRESLELLLPDFPIRTLLTFLPDVRLKRRSEDLAQKAMAVDVNGLAGIRSAEAALVELKASVTEIDSCFKDVVDLANQLHKRLTGLRSDFRKPGQEAIDVVGKRIYAEVRRLEQVARNAQREAQRVADEKARQAAAEAIEKAKQQQAPPAVVAEMQRQAVAVAAPPVQVARPSLGSSAAVAKYKGRLVGTTEADEPCPGTADEMTAQQQESFLKLVQAVAKGDMSAPLLCLSPNWKYIHKRADADKSTFVMAGIEIWDAGGLRSKGGRK